MNWYGPHMGGGGWGWALGLGSLMFWVVLALAIVALVLYFTRGGRRPLPPYQGYGTPGPHAQPGPGPAPSHPAPNPDQILAERFARGEIDEEEFRQRLGTLRATAPGAASPPS